MERYRFASVQLDGGLQQVAAKVETQFRELHALLLKRIQAPARVPASMSELRIGIMADGQVDECLQRAVGLVVQAVCGKGGTVVLAGSLRSGRVLQVQMGLGAWGIFCARSAMNDYRRDAQDRANSFPSRKPQDALAAGLDSDTTLGFGQRFASPGMRCFAMVSFFFFSSRFPNMPSPGG